MLKKARIAAVVAATMGVAGLAHADEDFNSPDAVLDGAVAVTDALSAQDPSGVIGAGLVEVRDAVLDVLRPNVVDNLTGGVEFMWQQAADIGTPFAEIAAGTQIVDDAVAGGATTVLGTIAGAIAGGALPDPGDLPDPTTTDPTEFFGELLGGGGENPPPATTISETGTAIDVAATGTMPAADQTCVVDVTSLTFDFGTVAAYSDFTGASDTQTLTVACGADRSASTNVYLTTTEADPTAGGGTATLGGTVDAQPVVLTMNYDSAGTFMAIGSQVATVDAGASSAIDLQLAFDKTTAPDGGAISADAGSKVYVYIQ